MWIPKKYKKEFKSLHTSESKVKRRILVQPQVGAQKHSLYPTLRQWGTKGVPVNCGPDWDWNVIKQAVSREPHNIALEAAHPASVQEEIRYQVEEGFSQIIPWGEMKKMKPNICRPPFRILHLFQTFIHIFFQYQDTKYALCNCQIL